MAIFHVYLFTYDISKWGIRRRELRNPDVRIKPLKKQDTLGSVVKDNGIYDNEIRH